MAFMSVPKHLTGLGFQSFKSVSRRPSARASAQMHLKWWQTVGPLLASQFMNVQVLSVINRH